jgi:RNA polymerase sigma factor (sigma-70 family)
MATGQLSTVLRHIRNLAAGRSLPMRTDGQLLDDFSGRRDEAAFAALVARHGPMVFRVCRRVLNHEQDAEDAFQAVFLVLARNVGSIQKREALANWLYGVAYRTSMKAKRSAARRRNQERLGALTSQAATYPTWDDVQAALDEEIQRLPRAFRSAFVLCVLEGKSAPEAAAELGVEKGTVSSRLTRARQRLQKQLARRGINLGAMLAALSVAEIASKAAVPADLAAATLRCGVWVAAGQPGAGLIPSHISALAAGVSRAMFLTKVKIALFVISAAGLIATAGALTHQALGSGKSQPGVRTLSAPSKPEQPTTKTRPKPPAADGSTESVTYSGRVLGPDGKPLAGANVYYHFITRQYEPTPVRARTDDQGKFWFALTQQDVPLSADAINSDPLRRGHVVVKADGFAFAWRTITKPTGDLAIQLSRDDAPLEGRIVNLEGKPLAGLHVSARSAASPDSGDLTDFLKALRSGNSLYDALFKNVPNYYCNPIIGRQEVPLLPSTTTGADGRFRLQGFAKEQLVELRIEGPTIETQQLFVLTRTMPRGSERLLTAPRIKDPVFGPDVNLLVLWNGFDHAAPPGQVVVGTVHDETTDRPIPGVIVESYMLAGTRLAQNSIYRTVADERGHYRFIGLPRGKGNRLRFRPPPDQPYLPVVKEVSPSEAFAEATLNAALPRGVWVDVTVKDKATGKPVSGYVSYFVLPAKPFKFPVFDRPFADAYNDMMAIRNDGTFRFVAVSRPAIVAFRTDWEKFPIAREAAAIRLPSMLSPSNYQAFAEINPKAHESVKVQFVLDALREVKGSLVGPDDQPITGVLPAGLRDDWFWGPDYPLKTAEFTALGLEPNRPRLLCFVHCDKKVAGSVVARGNEKAPLTVKLAPWATVSGRLLDAEGKPIKKASLRFTEVPVRKPGQPMSLEVGLHVIEHSAYKPSRDPLTDGEGRFHIEGLVPGLTYHLALVDDKGAVEFDQIRWTGLVFTNLILNPGETKNLGDVKLQPFPKK